MTRRTKTLIATIVILFFWLPAYAVFIAGLQWRVLPGAPWYVSLAFYALTGTFWMVPIGLALPWMYREPGTSSARAKRAGGGDAVARSRAGEGRGESTR